MVHGVAEGLSAGFGDLLDHDLVELALEDVFAHAAVEECRLVQRGPHLLDELAKEGLADEIGEGVYGRPWVLVLHLGDHLE